MGNKVQQIGGATLLGGATGGLLAAGGGKLGDLFSGGPSTLNTSSSSAPNQYTLPAYQQMLSQGKNLSANPNASYGMMNTAQQQGLGMAQNAANSPLVNAGNQAMTDTASGKYLDQSNNPALQGVINNALGQVRGQVGSTFSGNNFGSSAHEQLMNTQMTNALAPTLFGNYQQERQNQMNAAGQAPNYAFQAGNNLMNAGNMQQQAAMNQQGLLGSTVQTGINGGLNTQGVQPNPNQGSTLGNVLGAGASIAGMASMFSDRKLKKNIKRIGTHILGIGIYAFDYLWGEHAEGVMAQDVLKVKPEAVSVHPSGYLVVDYAILGRL